VRLLITGAEGQLATDLRGVLQGEVHALSRRELDITDREEVFRRVERIRPAWVINAAAYNDVDGAETEVEQAFAVNGRGPGNLADAATANGASIVHVSTDYVFDGEKGTAYNEDDLPNPINAYGRSKREGEMRVLASGAPACLVRTAWLYGRHGNNFVKMVQAAAKAGKPLRMVTDQVGSPTWTADLATAIVALVNSPARGLFHVTNAGACSRFEQAKTILGSSTGLIPISSGESHRPARRPKNSSLTSVRWPAAGFTPLPPWQDALARFLKSVPD
jgi:dTDP-4-dehydrorhamnose reductase